MTVAPDEVEERARRQRERILRAAHGCFVEHGFHAASMASIAKAAEMSPGLIYRYFSSKGEIVRVIIDRQLEESGRILERLRTPADLVEAILDAFEEWRRPGEGEASAALCLETTAAAARDPDVAAATRAADRLVVQRLQGVLRRSLASDGREPAPEVVRRRALVLHTVVEGLMVRALRDPGLDRELLRQSIEEVVARLLGD